MTVSISDSSISRIGFLSRKEDILEQLVDDFLQTEGFFLGDAIAMLIAMWRVAFRRIGPVAMLVGRLSS
jgi:hypothetical protein